MKKYLGFAFLGLIMFLMSACSTSITISSTTEDLTTTTTETPLTSIDFDFSGYDGSGTVTDPYVVDVVENRSFSKTINFHILDNPLEYTQGNIVDGVFIPYTEEEGISILDSNSFSLVIEAYTIGVYYIMISSTNAAPTYVKVNVNEYVVDFSKSLKVLAIGNSFSVDGMEYLYKIADNYGISEIILGNLYIGGCSLEMHATNILNNNANYVYYKNTNDSWEYASSNATILDGLLDEDWDIITIQQVSSYSGVPSTYNEDLDTIINYINANKTNAKAEIVWHMTWAYEENSTHPNFVTYNSDQLTMYNAIVNAVNEKIDTRDDISYTIPSGTAIQNVRTSYIGDTLCRDTYHLSYDKGRYTAGLTWFLKITGLPIDSITYIPEGVTLQDPQAIIASVKAAVENPYVVTQSQFTTP